MQSEENSPEMEELKGYITESDVGSPSELNRKSNSFLYPQQNMYYW